ncbi:hypothetical protein K7I13_05890 [Brucepastera parasyntrophica]|uniref:hypothetical protein n=1 Tax=Brucepastera parasyntrophica TaxID=2880008 RepID=UPI00210CA9BA|nr:hypothetical protein [Brucepastera parasyntrophica]ULQ60796.1 hypothetical protein K7I13_05890 [Brucepastera parasyntrophica]
MEEYYKKVYTVLSEIYNSDKIIPDHCQNERYLHHYFSRKIQDSYRINYANLIESKLHSEWPTYKKETDILFAKYRYNKETKVYEIIDPTEKIGRGGFIDFAIDEYKNPRFAIDFTAKYSWDSEDIIFDFMKLLDSRNQFTECISFNLLFDEKDLRKKGSLTRLENKMNAAKKTRKKDLESILTETESFFSGLLK